MNTPTITICSGRHLRGTVQISGAKNAALPLIAATLLTPEPSRLNRIPDITDIHDLLEIIRGLGASASFTPPRLSIAPTAITSYQPNPQLVEKFRGSVLLIPPLLIRTGRAHLHFPGGCNLGARSLDTHLDAFRQMGVKIQTTPTQYNFSAPKTWPKSREVVLSEMSVTATENILMLASALPGTTTIRLASFEPEIIALGELLQKMGAQITGLGTPTIKVAGTTKLRGATHTNIFDRIEAATFATAAILTNGDVVIEGFVARDLDLVIKKFIEIGAQVDIVKPTTARIRGTKVLQPFYIQTNVFPNFPTDLQPIFGILATQAKGRSQISELLYSNRFGYLISLQNLGVHAEIPNPHLAYIEGKHPIGGGQLAMPDIRGGAALVLAGLVASKPITLTHTHFLHRGYEDFVGKLASLGADISQK